MASTGNVQDSDHDPYGKDVQPGPGDRLAARRFKETNIALRKAKRPNPSSRSRLATERSVEPAHSAPSFGPGAGIILPVDGTRRAG
jgi:hypothetical protein